MLIKNPQKSSTINRGIEFLITKQTEDGAWKDFKLPPGVSDIWVTAYTGLHLYQIFKECQFEDQKILNKAVNWLTTHMGNDAGWAYNAQCPSDADSTANAILFLQKLNFPISHRTYFFLLSFRKQDGGFCTYYPEKQNDSWGISHPDVTPVIGMALLKMLKNYPTRLNQLKGYIQQGQNKQGLWQSFWWKTPLYSTARNLDFAQEASIQYKLQPLKHTLLKTSAKNPFEIALALYCLLKLGVKDDLLPMLETLCQLQLPDGSWSSSPILRLTSRENSFPWKSTDSGRLYCDQNRILTTATVLRSISLFHIL